ncbi:hypothetical protein [Undibacterium fentianense]|uniref:Uncharacterized protein n=1 Tax=Undibacterium fentianense TaxID=2828728 RepID=A0A941E7F1_9BURK|nr:hypothetical protein [Undibacterium fentianense]MBR7801118.1 hypothetical protein [Undibacterium fentianense]
MQPVDGINIIPASPANSPPTDEKNSLSTLQAYALLKSQTTWTHLRRLSMIRWCIVLLAFACRVSAQTAPPDWQLPNWAQRKLPILAREKHIEFSTRINPFVWRADFDGDGVADYAVFIKSSTTGKEGISFLLRKEKSPFLIGAGTAFGNDGDDFSWLDLWSIEDRGTLQTSYYEKSVRLNRDSLLVAKSESASALIYFKSGKLIWQQQGD